MASAVASTSTYIFPQDSISPSLLVKLQSPSPSPPPSSPQDRKPTALVLDKSEARGTSGGRAKRFMCLHPGCGKCYTRPIRLEEHQRTHTGERPFHCPSCSSTFARDSHLKAHMRTHAGEGEKKYPCVEDGCDKKFWTNQHLKKHVEVVHRGKTYDCPDCDEAFRKHHLLRTHIAAVHSTPGTNPFICEHPGCDRSFKQKVHLKSHEKTHDPTRYVCLHPSCLPLPLSSRQFPTWTLLQKHSKSAHPPTCPYAECEGKTFTSNRGLRNHLESHKSEGGGGETTEVETEAEGVAGGGKKTKRRTRGRGKRRARGVGVKQEDGEGEGAEGSEHQADGEQGGTEEEREEEVEVENGEEGDEDEEARDARMREDFRYGGKKKRKVLAEAVGFPPLGPLPVFPLPSLPDPTLSSSDEHSSSSARRLPSIASVASSFYAVPAPAASSSSSASSFHAPPAPAAAYKKHKAPFKPKIEEEDQSAFFDLLTGSNYSQPGPSTSRTNGGGGAKTGGLASVPRKYPCPFPSILALPFTDLGPRPAPPSSSIPPSSDDGHGHGHGELDDMEDDEGTCKFWFKRVYDVERHLRARHGVEMVGGRGVLHGWFREEEEQ